MVPDHWDNGTMFGLFAVTRNVGERDAHCASLLLRSVLYTFGGKMLATDCSVISFSVRFSAWKLWSVECSSLAHVWFISLYGKVLLAFFPELTSCLCSVTDLCTQINKLQKSLIVRYFSCVLTELLPLKHGVCVELELEYWSDEWTWWLIVHFREAMFWGLEARGEVHASTRCWIRTSSIIMHMLVNSSSRSLSSSVMSMRS